MNPDHEIIRQRLDQLAANTLSKEEFDRLFAAIADDSREGLIKAALLEAIENEPDAANIPGHLDGILRRILANGSGKAPVRRLPVWRTAAVAASVFLALGIGAYFLAGRKHDTETAARRDPVVKNDVLPGGNKAILMLANGTAITLDDAANGVLAQQGKATVRKLNSGQLAYDIQHEKPTEVLYNTLVTPRGGQYQLVLPDGSKVWLNAASSIRYPVSFAAGSRQVDITGEAYLEIAKDASKPFVVRLGTPAGAWGVVKVLGTQFNVNAYEDEPIVRTTLLEGAVQVTSNAASAMLAPGQQADLTNDGKLMVAGNADLPAAVAWKDGRMIYHHATIESIMRQVARWYDVEVVYKNKIEDSYTVNIPRNVPVSRLVQFLEMSGGVHFIIEGKKITITQ